MNNKDFWKVFKSFQNVSDDRGIGDILCNFQNPKMASNNSNGQHGKNIIASRHRNVSKYITSQTKFINDFTALLS